MWSYVRDAMIRHQMGATIIRCLSYGDETRPPKTLLPNGVPRKPLETSAAPMGFQPKPPKTSAAQSLPSSFADAPDI
jgi:hypothetical protein